MATTIRISNELKRELAKRKLSDRDSYEDVLWDLIEGTKELSEETKKDIEQARKEFREGKFYTHEQVKKELGL